MTLVLARPLVSLDVETHDKCPPSSARIVELGFRVDYHDNRPPKRWVSLVDPGVPITAGATAVHGIADGHFLMCTKCQKSRGEHPQWEGNVAVNPQECPEFHPVPRFADLAKNLAAGFTGVDFCGYNVGQFDLPVLAAEFARAGVTWTYNDARLVDPLRLWRVQQRHTLADAVREFLKREPTDAHRALGDAEDAREVALAMLERWPKLPRDVRMLHDLCFDSNGVDSTGKFIWKDGEAMCNFGKHKGAKLKAMSGGYLKWMVEGDFPSDVKKIVAEALEGRYPTK